jgi:hypothetical protein
VVPTRTGMVRFYRGVKLGFSAASGLRQRSGPALTGKRDAWPITSSTTSLASGDVAVVLGKSH